jgi:DNA adenine methylase
MDFNNFLSSVAKTDVKQIDSTPQPKPFVKWVGGKRAIMSEILQHIPPNINNYYEPFVGDGALFFEIYNMVNGKCYLSDMNVDLVIAYNIIKTKPQQLIELLKNHKENHNEEYYYKIRELQELSDPIENSARFIYLMKTCFNGLWRVNKENRFNTPIGSYKNPNICDGESIFAVNKALQAAEIRYQDFMKITP